MLRTVSSRTACVFLGRQAASCNLSSSSSAAFPHQPNAPIDLDPSLRQLLSDVDLSLLKHRTRPQSGASSSRSHRELEVVTLETDVEADYLSSEELDLLKDREDRAHRKSPAALFGSQRIGAITIPFELQKTISSLIAESDKPLLHADAERLFLDDSSENPEWNIAFNKRYKSRQQARFRAARDATAFASVALPAQYSVIYSILDHIKHRLGPQWKVTHVIDWGSGTGGGLWASTHSFRKTQDFESSDALEDMQLSQSSLASYLGVEKRDGLMSIGKRLLKDVSAGDLSITWKRSFAGSEPPTKSEHGEILALSAFLLSTLSSSVARKSLLKEIWESGADTIILIDHSTKAGFEAIAEARQFLLRKGRQESDDPTLPDSAPKGCHVVAPCPHDGACPLYQPGSKLICSFSQRLQRPDFVRKTKHSGAGHEDNGYSYVVIRRGTRSARVNTKVGRVGEVGRREQEKAFRTKAPMPELQLDGEPNSNGDAVETPSSSNLLVQEPVSQELAAALRAEAYNWPRLVFPPLKKSGHIILDGCTHEGKIMRMTIPRSQGKQPFYDARKSQWGDIFPHEPKNRPQERYLPQGGKRRDGIPLKGADIGKRDTKDLRKPEIDFEAVEAARRERRRVRLIERKMKETSFGA